MFSQKQIISFLLIFVLAYIPIQILINHYSPKDFFLQLIYFGQQFEDRSSDEINQLVPRHTNIGYDGQFYAQLALDPGLINSTTKKALDSPNYRAQRIGLPIAAHILGLGKTRYILHIYSLINFGFWILFLCFLLKELNPNCLKDILLFVAIFWSSGTLISLSKSVTDFPAAAIALFAIMKYKSLTKSSIRIAIAGLVKETSIISLIATNWINKNKKIQFRNIVISATLIAIPTILWHYYVNFRFGSPSASGLHNFGWPLTGIVDKIYNSFHALYFIDDDVKFTQKIYLFFELICPISLLVQAIYLLLFPKFTNQFWRFGIGFVFLLIMVSPYVWNEQYAYTRVFLPLTFGFNFLIYKVETGRRFFFLYGLGNIGLSMIALENIF